MGKPFIKWAGGKTSLLNDISNHLPISLKNKPNITYIEPFIGGGAVLFYLLEKYPHITRAIINDINQNLIFAYRVIKEQPIELINLLSIIEKEYLERDENDRKEYYLLKREEYNKNDKSEIEIAALFIFLNKTCFNGLYRVNSKGKFNVPHGRYSRPKICDRETILEDSKLLQNVEILCGDFQETIKYVDNNTLVYLDPPYKEIKKNISFVSYDKNKFNDEEQIRLKKFVDDISKKGGQFLLSNSDIPNDNFFDELYKEYNIERVNAPRFINSDKNGRGKISELLISNIK